MRKLFKIIENPWVAWVAISAVVIGAVLAVRALGGLQRWELFFLDRFTKGAMDPEAKDERIAIVGMTEDDLTKYGFPLDDEHLADLLEKIDAQKPAVIGLDLYRDLEEPRDKSLYPKLAATLRKLERFFAIERIGYVAGPKALKEMPEKVVGNNLPKDHKVDGVYRRGPLIIEIDRQSNKPSLSFALAIEYLSANGVSSEQVDSRNEDTGEPVQLLKVGNVTFPRLTKNAGGYVEVPAENYEYLASFRGPYEHLHIDRSIDRLGQSARDTPYDYSFGELLSGKLKSGKLLPPDALNGKIVLVATVMQSVKDSNPTPIYDNLRGVQYHAMLVHQLLEAGINGVAPMTWWPDWGEVLWIAGWSLAGSGIALMLRSPVKLGPSLALTLGGVYWAGSMGFNHGVWLLVAAPALACFLSAAIATSYVVFLERADRRVMQSLFSKHVSKKVANELWKQREHFLDGGKMPPRVLTATVVFTDLVGFSTASEKLTAQQTMAWLNEYMDVMARFVEEYEGTVNKYIGDAIMAVFGAPVAHQDKVGIDADAVRAVRCALKMRQEVPTLNSRWLATAPDMPPIAMRVGIFTGPLVDGSFGTAERIEYTVIGDTVNRANRLEAAGKEIKDQLTEPERLCPILIGPETFERVGHFFETAPVPDMALKGISERVTVYRVLSGRTTNSTT